MVLDDIHEKKDVNIITDIIPFREKGLWGYVDLDGDVRIEPTYELASFFTENLAIVSNNHLGGFINVKGEVVVEPKYQSMTVFNSGYAWGRKEGDWELIKDNGMLKLRLSAYEYSNIDSFSCGLSRFERNGLYGYLNTEGEEVISPVFADSSSFYEGLAYARLDEGEYAYIDKYGDAKIQSDQYVIGAVFSEGLAVVHTRTFKTAYIDTSGQIIISPRVESGGFFSEGMTQIYNPINNKYGYMNRLGEVVIPCIYDAALSFYQGIAFVTLNDTVNAINRFGELLYVLPSSTELNTNDYTKHPEIISVWIDNDYSKYIYLKRSSGQVVFSYFV